MYQWYANTGNDVEEISRLWENLAIEYEMKNLEGLKYFLRIEVDKSGKRGLLIAKKVCGGLAFRDKHARL